MTHKQFITWCNKFTNAEMAALLGCGVRHVQKLKSGERDISPNVKLKYLEWKNGR